jgi:hypothetical protein
MKDLASEKVMLGVAKRNVSRGFNEFFFVSRIFSVFYPLAKQITEYPPKIFMARI